MSECLWEGPKKQYNWLMRSTTQERTILLSNVGRRDWGEWYKVFSRRVEDWLCISHSSCGLLKVLRKESMCSALFSKNTLAMTNVCSVLFSGDRSKIGFLAATSYSKSTGQLAMRSLLLKTISEVGYDSAGPDLPNLHLRSSV